MNQYGLMTVALPSGTEILLTRDFRAPRRVVFDTFSKAGYLKQWLSGPEGWLMTTCEVALTVGGTYRYRWLSPDAVPMSVHGRYLEVVAPARLAMTERYDDPWYPGEARIVVDLANNGPVTSLWYTITYETQIARDMALQSSLPASMSASFDRLDHLLDAPLVTDFTPQHIATIHVTVPRQEIHQVMGPGIQELMSAVDGQGIATTGPWFTHHLRMHPDTFDFEIGVPVASPVTPSGRVVPGRRPAARVARVVHHGPYEGLSNTWGSFAEWIAANGFTPADDVWEMYAVGPESSDDPRQWRTELYRPLQG